MKQLLRPLFIFLLLCCAGVVSAQDARTPITIDNAADLQPLSIVGSALPGKLAYSPDGRFILAATTEHTTVYLANDLYSTPKTLPFINFDFNPAGELVADGQIWNLNTGQSIGIAAGTRILPPSEESPTTRIEITKPGGEVMLVDMGDAYLVQTVVVNQYYTRLAVATNNSENTTTTIRLYGLPDGRLYALLPQSHPEVVYMFFSTETSVTSEQLMINTYQPYFESFDGDKHPHQINLYWSETGLLRDEYSGASYKGLYFNADKSVMAYDLNDEQIIVKSDAVFSSIPIEKLNKGNYQSFILVVWGQKIMIKQPDMEKNEIYTITSDHRPIVLTWLLEPDSYQTGVTVQEQWVVIKKYNEIHIWNTSDPNPAPYTLVAETASQPDISISSHETYIAYNIHTDKGNRRIVYDFVGESILTNVPISIVMNPDWSSLSYWEYGTIIVRDLNSLTDITLTVIPDYVGTVADVDYKTGRIAFSGEKFRVVNLTRADPLSQAIEIPLTDPVPYDGQFIHETGDIVVLSLIPGAEKWSNSSLFLNEYILAEDLLTGRSYDFGGSSGNFTLSPNGYYIVAYDIYCESVSVYVAPTVNIHPFVDMSSKYYPSMTSSMYACGAKSYAFTSDDRIFYGVNGGGLLRLTLSDNENRFSRWEEEPLLYYANHISAHSIILSPNEQMVAIGISQYDPTALVPNEALAAVGIIHYDIENMPLTYSIEVFTPNGLAAYTQRDDIDIILTIPDATTALFSPDNQMVVSDVGLYSLETGLINPAINGTISAFSPDSTLIATYQDGYVTLWDVHDAEPLAQYPSDGVTELGFSPDGSRLYIVRGGDVQVWSIGG